MIAICKNNSNTWRDTLTIGKEYPVIKSYNDEYAGYLMIGIKCDDGKIRTYRADRFELKDN